MRTKSILLKNLFLAALCCSSLGVLAVRADDGQQGGDDVQGTESMDVELQMTPTASAPAGSSIQLSLEGEDDNGTMGGKLDLETQNLPPGTYSVSVTLKSDGSTVALGTFTVDSEGEGEIQFGDEGTPFPANFNPFDIATVTVSDANGVALFTADLTTASTGSSSINAMVQATAGPAAPNATGSANLVATLSNGKAKGSLQFSAQSLPPSLPVVIALNGIAAKNLKTDKMGNASVKIGPKGKNKSVVNGVNLTQITSASLMDKSGNVLLQANF